ncbi:unnamed protein product [Eruca vesicaria subsp. sativa]|uniref:PUM-HD domain-containing protein n=1 Tax=Eruca vesicaria subsp. sativa TaxID=29727 RepID=A0ABC8K8G1_ERUVS|nr:unnamed protein product [Eruca vesicaria subsp. sativa]
MGMLLVFVVTAVDLSFKKYGSYIVEKLLDTEESMAVVVVELLECDGDRLMRLARNEFGSFVVVKALRVTQEMNRVDMFRGLVQKLMPLRHLLNAQLQSDLDGRLAELAQSQAEKQQLHLQSVEKNYNECSSSLTWHKERLRELETKISSLQEELSSCKDAAATTEEQYNAELSTANKLVDLYKESSEEWSRKAGELEGVVKALEARLIQEESEYNDRLEKEMSTNQQFVKENEDLKQKLEKLEAEIEKSRKTNELTLLPLSSFTGGADDSGTRNMIRGKPCNNSKVPTGVSGTALAASLLRDGWSLAKIYEKYQEAVDAMRHEQLGRKEAELILQRVLSELEEKAEFIQEERVMFCVRTYV